MAINGIGAFLNYSLNRNYSNYYSTVNQIRLQQALEKNGYGGSNVERVSSKYNNLWSNYKDSITSVGSNLSSSMNFVKSYSSSISDLMYSANSLRESNRSGVWNQLETASSNENLLTASGKYGLKDGQTYQINIQQLAAAQTNRSQDVESQAFASEDLSFQVTDGTGAAVSVNVSAMKEDGTKKTNSQVLSEATAAINGAKAGVSAAVVEKDGKSSLEIRAKDTGEDSRFTVTGTFAESSGLSQVQTQGQNAVYSVKTGTGYGAYDRTYTSQTNDVTLDYGKIAATLKGTGEVSLTTRPDPEKVITAVEDLVKNYNHTVGLMSENAARGSGASRVMNQLGSLPASEKNMEKIGITMDEGKMVLNKEKLAESLEKSPDMAKTIIGSSYGLAQGVYNKAVSGKNVSSASLINHDMQILQNNQFNSINLYNMYSRTSSYGLNNFALGSMLDLFA